MRKCVICGAPTKRVTCGQAQCQIANRNILRKKHFERFERKTERKIIAMAGAV